MNGEPLPIHLLTASVQFGRWNYHLGIALGPYWSVGARLDRDHLALRLPFLNVSRVRAWVPRKRLRVAYMGWRGINHSPRPELRQWNIGGVA